MTRPRGSSSDIRPKRSFRAFPGERDDEVGANGSDPAESWDPRPRDPQHADITQLAREATRGGPDEVEPERDSTPADVPQPVGLGAQRTLRERRRRTAAVTFHAVCALAAAVGVVTLVVLLADILNDGLGQIDRQFLTSFASRIPERAGIKA